MGFQTDSTTLTLLMIDSTSYVLIVKYLIYYLCFECKYVISIITKNPPQNPVSFILFLLAFGRAAVSTIRSKTRRQRSGTKRPSHAQLPSLLE